MDINTIIINVYALKPSNVLCFLDFAFYGVSGKMNMVGCGHRHGLGHGQFQNTHLQLHNTYLTLLLQQHLLPNPVVDPIHCFYPFISAGVKWSKDRPAF